MAEHISNPNQMCSERRKGTRLQAGVIALVAVVGLARVATHNQPASAHPRPKISALQLREPTREVHKLNVKKVLAKSREPKVNHLDAWENQLIRPTAIVLHWTAVYPDNVQNLVKGMDGNHVSVQIFIDKQGRVHQLTDPVNTMTAHAEGVNDRTIGIEIEGSGSPELLANLRQLVSVVEVTRDLLDEFNIPAVNDMDRLVGVVGHHQVDGSKWDTDYDGKSDPGDAYLFKVLDLINQFPAP